MKRWISGLVVGVLLGSLFAASPAAQGRFWVLVNGALQYTGIVVMNGTQTVNKNGLATTSTTGMTLQNTTPATSGATVQISPRFMKCGNAWDTSASETVCFFDEVLPATAATPTGTWKLGYSLNGAAATYPLTVTSAGVVTALSNISTAGALVSTGDVVQVPNSQSFQFASNTKFTGVGNGTFNFTNTAVSAGIGFDVTTDGTLMVRTRAQSGYGTVDALGYKVSNVSGATHAACSTSVTAITVTGGIITAITCT